MWVNSLYKKERKEKEKEWSRERKKRYKYKNKKSIKIDRNEVKETFYLDVGRVKKKNWVTYY